MLQKGEYGVDRSDRNGGPQDQRTQGGACGQDSSDRPGWVAGGCPLLYSCGVCGAMEQE